VYKFRKLLYYTSPKINLESSSVTITYEQVSDSLQHEYVSID